MITQEELKEMFYYNPDTGQLTRKTIPSNRVKVGDAAGSPNKGGYLVIHVKGKQYLAHRLIWLYIHGSFPEEQLDHIDGNRLNNRLSNLRAVSHQENSKNKAKNKNNTSGVMGVHWYKRVNKWTACIVVQGKQKHLGYFLNFDEAVKVRKEAENKYGYHLNHGRGQ